MSSVATIESDIGRHEREWERLVESSGASPFHELAWVKAWWSAFGRGSLMLVTVRREGELAAALPLRQTRGRISSPTNWHSPVFGLIADAEDSARELLDYVFGLEHRSIDLSHLDVDDGSLEQAVQAAQRAGRLVATRPLARSPWINLEGAWEDYEQRLSRNRRKSVRRSLRRLEETGTVSLHVEDGSSGLNSLLEEAFRLEASGWKGRRGTAISSRPETRRFYTDVARWAAEKGWLRLALLRLDGTPIAFDLSLERGSVRYSLKAGFDAEFARFGPGAVLLHRAAAGSTLGRHRALRAARPRGPFKLDWADNTSERAWLHASAPSSAGRLEAAVIGARERIRPLARRVRDRSGRERAERLPPARRSAQRGDSLQAGRPGARAPSAA